MSFSIMNYKKAVGLSFLFLVCCFSGVNAKSLVIAGNEYTGNWNPLAASTIPAKLVGDLIAEKLYRKRCTGPRLYKEYWFEHYCTHSSADVSPGGSLRLVMDKKKCRLGPRPINRKDVAFSLSEINSAKENEHRIYKLKLDGRNRLRIGFPLNPSVFVAKNILQFPIIRSFTRDDKTYTPGDFAVRRITIGDEKYVNAGTAGPFLIGKIDERTVNLLAREKSQAKIKNITYIYYDRFLELRTVMRNAKERPDVVLSFPSDKADSISLNRYRPREHSIAAQVTYLGYNFKTDDRLHRSLAKNPDFRKLMTSAVWSIPMVQRTVGIVRRAKNPRGIWLGPSPDPNERRGLGTRTKGAVRKSIQRFLDERRFPKNVNMRVLVSPVVVKRQFDEADRRNISEKLNDLWRQTEKSRGMNFELIDPAGMEGYRKNIKSNNYHMVLDSQMFGSSRYGWSYMLFMKPGSTRNFLGIDVFSRSEIDKILSDGAKGKKRFLEKFERTHPISVIGHFPSRVLLSASLGTGKACPKGTFSHPFYNIQNWSKSVLN